MATAPPLRRADLHPRLIERYEALVQTLTPSGDCLLRKPYGRNQYAHVDVLVDNRRHRQLGHRVAFVLNHRDLEAGEVVMHSCDRPLCWNPAHLSAGTHQDNSDDMRAKGRQARGRPLGGVALVNAQKTHCIRGHQDWGTQTGGRICRTCEREQAALRYQRRKAAKHAP